ncbi:MAG: hypothetical protein H6821_11080 [Planctomycetaceae bacterium]|nr:hypothetical protein [Planctomycetaceae bacterium]
MGKSQVHPELASGIINNPPAGIVLIQQPGRLTCVNLLFFPVARWHMVGLAARKKTVDAEVDNAPQPYPPRANCQSVFRSPVCR